MSLRIRFALVAFALGLVVVLVIVRWSFERNLDEIRVITRASHTTLANETAELAQEALYHEDHGSLQIRLATLIQTPEVAEGLVWNDHGKVVAASNQSLVGALRPSLDGDGWIAIQLSDLGGANLGGVALHFSDEALEMANSRAERDGFMIAVAGMLGFAVIAFLLGSALTRRLKRLSFAAGSVAAGDTGARTGVTGKDEIGQLARTFDLMASEIEIEGIRLREEIDERRNAEKALRRRESSLSALTLMTATNANSEHPIDALLQLLAAECQASVVGVVNRQEAEWQTMNLFPEGQTLTKVNSMLWERALSEGEVMLESSSPTVIEAAIPIVAEQENFGVLVLQDAQNADEEFLSLVGRWLSALIQREALQNQLIHNERMVSIGTLSSGIAHEINNPLTVIMGSISLAQRLLREDGAEVRENLNCALEAAERCAKIVESLKTLSRPSREAELDLVDPKVAIETATRNLKVKTSGIARVTLDIDSLPNVLANETLLSQVVFNLITNAADAIEPGAEDENEIRVDGWVDGPMVAIRVTDTGSGIDPAQLSRVMDPFFTTKAPGEGTGLGLYLCHQIAASFGGNLAIESALQGGTAITLRVPIAPQQKGLSEGSAQKALSEGSAQPKSETRLRILIVDDSPVILELARKALEGHELVTAADRESALALVRSEEFDCIVSDIRMPGGNGLDLYDELVNEDLLGSSTFAFMTGGTSNPAEEARLAKTRRRVLTKPFTLKGLRSFIEEGVNPSD